MLKTQDMWQRATFTHPMMMVIGSEAFGLIVQVADLATSEEHPTADPMLDEWIKLARAMLDVITAFGDTPDDDEGNSPDLGG
jgi:hypothetical protein